MLSVLIYRTLNNVLDAINHGPSSVLVKRKSWKVKMDPGRDPTAGLFSGLIVIGTVNIWCTKRSGLYRYYSFLVMHEGKEEKREKKKTKLKFSHSFS